MITVEINSVDVTSQIEASSLRVIQKITYQVDTAFFVVHKAGSKTLTPAYDDDVVIYDGSEKVFAGKILSVETNALAGPAGITYQVHCVDHTYEMDKVLASRTYEDKTISYIISDLITSYTSGFTTNNVTSSFTIEKIVFNQLPLSTCIKRLAAIVNYDWYVDEDKDVHFFEKFTNTAPFSVTDSNGKYIPKTLERVQDGSEVTNRVKVRGGEYNGSEYTDEITVVGNDTKSFKLPYRFANLSITLDTGGGPVAQNVGIDFVDDFTSNDVLYNFQEQMIRWENALSDGDVISFTGNPKRPVFAVSEDPISIAAYGRIEKFIREEDIESNVVARKRASAELYQYSEPIIDAKFRTYESGLRAGQILEVQSDIQSIADSLIIKELHFSMRDHNTFVYDVFLISTRRYNFISMLQKIIEPDPRPSDERETAEEIFTDTQIIEIAEEYEVVAAFEDIDQVIEIAENYEIDPLGASTNAEYVLAPYTPSSQSDTKRPGRLGISLVLY